MTIRPLKKTAIFDMDGTLNICGPYYDEAKNAGAQRIEKLTGMPAATARQLIEQLDLLAISVNPDPFSKTRFPRSFAAALVAAGVIKHGVTGYTLNAAELYKIGESVFDAPYGLFDGVYETLFALRATGWQLILYTKGDPEIQQRKIDKNHLAPFFHAIHIVPTKTIDGLRAVLEEHDVDLARSFAVGDSLKDDIAPAKALGLTTYYVNESGFEWSYDDHAVEPAYAITSVRDLVGCVEVGDGEEEAHDNEGGQPPESQESQAA